MVESMVVLGTVREDNYLEILEDIVMEDNRCDGMVDHFHFQDNSEIQEDKALVVADCLVVY